MQKYLTAATPDQNQSKSKQREPIQTQLYDQNQNCMTKPKQMNSDTKK